MDYVHRIGILRGLLDPGRHFYSLKIAEGYQGFSCRVIFFILCSVVLFSLSALLGVGTETMTHAIQLPAQAFAARKILFVFGQAIAGVLFAVMILYIPSLFFWSFLDVAFRKLVIIHFYVLIILLIEKAFNTILVISYGLEWFSSPLSFGVIGQSITNHPILFYFLGSITLFKAWAFFIQYVGLRTLLDQSKSKVILFIVLAMHLFFCFMNAINHSIDFAPIIFG